MHALAFDGTSARVVQRAPPASRARGEARLALLRGGICNTDLELARGYMGFRGVLGHEFVATVLAADDATLVGRRVVGGINCGCGECARCANGLERHCARRTVLGIVGRVSLPRNVTELAADDRTTREFDVVVEATGRREGLELALRRVVPLGTVVLKTTCADRHDVSLAPVVVDEIRVIGSRCGDMAAAVSWLESERLPVSELVAGRYALADAGDALEHAARPGALKVLVEGGVAS